MTKRPKFPRLTCPECGHVVCHCGGKTAERIDNRTRKKRGGSLKLQRPDPAVAHLPQPPALAVDVEDHNRRRAGLGYKPLTAEQITHIYRCVHDSVFEGSTKGNFYCAGCHYLFKPHELPVGAAVKFQDGRTGVVEAPTAIPNFTLNTVQKDRADFDGEQALNDAGPRV